MTDTEAINQARWQGAVDAKLDAVLARIDTQAADLARLSDVRDRVQSDLTIRVDSLESFRDRAIGVMIGAAFGGGVIGGSIASAVSYLIGA